MTVRVEAAVEEDLPAVRGLVGRVAGLPQWSMEAWREFLVTADGFHKVLLVARGEDGGVIGCLAGGGFEEMVELELLVTDPAYQRWGVGAELLRSWLAWAGGRGAREALLEVRAGNAAALRLYASAGFVEETRRRGYYREPTEDAVCMRFHLLKAL